MAQFNTSVMTLPDQGNQHRHAFHQLVLGLSGRIDFEVQGLNSVVDSHHASIIPTNIDHFFCGDDNNQALVLDIPETLNDWVPSDMIDCIFEKPNFIAIDNEFAQLVRSSVRELINYPNDEALAHHISVTLLLCARNRLQAPRSRTQSYGRFDTQKLLHFIESHLNESISIHQLAALVHLSPSQFHTRFKDRLGQTPHQYILMQRLDRAQQLLANAELSLNHIAELSGFSSQAAMTSSFRKYRDITPGRLRQH